jgi:uncharacterized repeat protein (TIGR04138 family)
MRIGQRIRRRRLSNRQNIKMHEASFEEGLEAILAKDSRYKRDGYLFLREALDFTQKATLRERREGLHVTGQELLTGIRDYALAQFGPMAITLLEEWGITRCEDFGEIVFNMIESGLLAKTDTDSREDFHNGYDFDEAFRKPFLPQSKTAKEIKPVV